MGNEATVKLYTCTSSSRPSFHWQKHFWLKVSSVDWSTWCEHVHIVQTCTTTIFTFPMSLSAWRCLNCDMVWWRRASCSGRSPNLSPMSILAPFSTSNYEHNNNNNKSDTIIKCTRAHTLHILCTCAVLLLPCVCTAHVSYRGWGTSDFLPLSPSFPLQSLLTSVLLSHSKSIMSPTLPSQKSWFYMKHYTTVYFAIIL